MTLIVIIAYLSLVLAIGLFSNRLLRNTGEDFFMATRSIGPFILLMSLFGTHMTAFSLLGASGEAYHNGIGVFALMASSSALVVPAVFYFVGTRAWGVGKRFGFLTQVQYFRARWGSDAFGLLLFIILVAFVVPYLLIGVMGGGITLNEITDGQVPPWVGGLLVSLVVLTYVFFGGLRGTAWANTFQTLVFMGLGAITFVIIVSKMGGLPQALAGVGERHPELLVREGKMSPMLMLTYTFIPLSVGMFPHIFMHWLSARTAATFKFSVIMYPLCVAIVWLPSVLLGILGSVPFEGLVGPQANSVLVKMIAGYAPGVLAGLLAAGVFAAVMSSLDSQVLAIGTMFTHDIAGHYGFKDAMTERQQVLYGRIFVAGILLFTYFLSLVADRSIFKLAVWSFTGFASLVPIVVAALYWRRSTSTGAIASALTVVVLWVYFFIQGWQTPGYTVAGLGILPVAVILLASTAAMVIGSLLSPPPAEALVQRFFAGNTLVAAEASGARRDVAA